MIPIAAITDEFSTTDLTAALDAMAGLGMSGVELRMVFGRNIIDLSNDELDAVCAAVAERGMKILSIASPVLKCVLPDAPALDTRFQMDVFGKAYTIEDQPQLEARAFEIAARTGAGIIRVFSYWRTVDPDRCFDRVASALRGLAERAADAGIVIGLENEHACNVATAAESARLLAAVDHPALQLIWDPANAFILGETPFPDGYGLLPFDRIGHVHAKDCHVRDYKPVWGPLGEMGIDWRGQVRALARDGYRGSISLETHWRGADGNRFEASMTCGRALHALVVDAETQAPSAGQET
jgi:L-ribulose-5-phosphate 3-epimerase